MAGLLAGKVAVVTGAASGNGRAIALAFAREGAKAVVVADLREDPREGGESTHELVAAQAGCTGRFVACDVTRPADLAAAVAAADEFGGVDVMVNNAGIFAAESFLDTTEAEYDRMMDVNLKGVFFGAQAAARRMVERGSGSIVNLSSIAGLSGVYDFPVYCASKGGIRLLTYALAAGLGQRGVRVNAIHPGLVETEMTRTDVPLMDGGDFSGIPLGRAGQPRDVANAAVFLASDLAGYVNGESLVVDGGMTNSRPTG
jgi:NAD(P)-dependent dehydrogenase (short-subunit alcohol dehydrogenase family)